MYGQQPWYYDYPPNVSYNPYLHSSYKRSSPYEPVARPIPRRYPNTRAAEERRRALAERRARRAQWLPDEVDEEEEDEDDWSYGTYAQPEPPHWEAKRRLQEEQAYRQQQEALRRQEEQRRQQHLLQEQMEEEQAKQRMWAEQRQQALKQEEEARQRAAAQDKTAPGRRARSRGRSISRERPAEAPQAPSKEAMAEPPEPMAAEPMAAEPVAAEPMAAEPMAAEPMAAEPMAAEPMAAEPQPQPESTSQTPKPRPSVEEQEKAARRIQQQYRTHIAKRTLDQVASDFEKLKNSFVYPRSIDFQRPGAPGEHVNVPANRPPSEFDKAPEEGEGVPMTVDGQEGKLGYSSRNYPLHSYVDALDKLLMRLDRVESLGNQDIRAKRRAIVNDIEKEASKLERYWKQAWADYPKNEPVQQTDAPAPVASEPNMDTTVPNFG